MTISLALVWLLLCEDGSTHMPPSQLAQWAIFENGDEQAVYSAKSTANPIQAPIPKEFLQRLFK